MALVEAPAMVLPPALAPYSRAFRVGGLHLHCYEQGSGARLPLLLVHGLGDEADTWRYIIGPLAASRRVLAPDLPGFGRSDKPRRVYSGAFFARMIAGLLGTAGIERPILIGSSLGAAIVQRVALEYPQRVAHLILIGGGLRVAPTLPPRPLWPFLTPIIGERVYTCLRAMPDTAYATLAPYYADFAALPAEDRAFLYERVQARVWSDEQRRAFLSALRQLSVERLVLAGRFRRRLARLHTPTTLIWGDSDRIVPVSEAHALAELLPHAQLHLIAHCGHLPQQEQPKQLLAVLENVLAQVR